MVIMNTRILSIVASAVVVALMLTSCATSTDPTASQRSLVATSSKGDVRLDVYATRPLVSGYNEIFFKIHRNGVLDRSAHLHMTPMMYMGSHDHSCPSIAPSETPDNDGFHSAAVMFTMPSDSLWFLNMVVHDAEHAVADSISVRVPVGSGNTVNVLRYGTNGTMVVTMMPPSAWKEGLNNVTFLLHTTEDGLNFVAVEDAVLSLTPSMPSMGHGSHGNVDPGHIGNGWYQGAVNLIMRGEWAIDLAAKQGDGLPWTTRFWIQVP
jgi:hypothetical protein